MGGKTWQYMLCFHPDKKEEEEEEEVKKKNKKESSEPNKITAFKCVICMEEDLPPSKRFNNNKPKLIKMTTKTLCSHKHPICTDCMIQYITIKITSDNTSKIRCPSLDCNKYLNPITCQSILPQSVFVRWCDSICESSLSDVPKAYCPNKSCSALVVNDCSDGGGRKKVVRREVECPDCGGLFCFQCKVPWHDGFWCDKDGVMKGKEDVLLEKVVKVNGWQRCPNCEHVVERSYGCYSVKCRCGYSFCYSCGAKLGWFPMFHNCPVLAKMTKQHLVPISSSHE